MNIIKNYGENNCEILWLILRQDIVNIFGQISWIFVWNIWTYSFHLEKRLLWAVAVTQLDASHHHCSSSHLFLLIILDLDDGDDDDDHDHDDDDDDDQDDDDDDDKWSCISLLRSLFLPPRQFANSWGMITMALLDHREDDDTDGDDDDDDD